MRTWRLWSAEIRRGAGAALITEEALLPNTVEPISEVVAEQPNWSELPFLVFAAQPSVDLQVRSFERLGPKANVTIIDRPIRIKTLVSVTRSALRARQHQYEVRDLLDALQERIHERDQFLAMLGHELRNPLYAIVLATEDGHELGAEELRDKVAVIRRQSKRLKRLVDDLLDISRVTRGKIELQKKTVDVSDLVRRCAEELRPTARQAGLTMRCYSGTGAVYASVDRVRIEQVVTNLVSNAIKYTPSGGSLTIRVDQDRDSAIVTIRDTGDGIAADVLPRVFDMFVQARTRRDVHQGGMGIGLTLVRNLIELHGGTVSVASEGHGKGSEFVIRLPLAEAPAETGKADSADPKEAELPHEILVVEDNPDIRLLLQKKLERHGHEVFVAEDGLRGVEEAIEHRPNLAVVDIGLPGIDGYEVARRIREAVGDEIVLVALTGYGQPEDRQRALEAGFDHHLTKPVDMKRLRELIAAAC